MNFVVGVGGIGSFSSIDIYFLFKIYFIVYSAYSFNRLVNNSSISDGDGKGLRSSTGLCLLERGGKCGVTLSLWCWVPGIGIPLLPFMSLLTLVYHVSLLNRGDNIYRTYLVKILHILKESKYAEINRICHIVNTMHISLI